VLDDLKQISNICVIITSYHTKYTATGSPK